MSPRPRRSRLGDPPAFGSRTLEPLAGWLRRVFGVTLALLLASCGGQVEREREAPRTCHEVRGYFADNRCSRSVTFDSCDRPAYVWAVRDFKCTQVRNP